MLRLRLRLTYARTPPQPVPPEFTKLEVKAGRERLNVSQPVFAKILGVSDDTVKARERGVNKTSGSAAILLSLDDL